MGTISKHKTGLSLLPSSSQLRLAITYIVITAIVLTFLNFYTAATTRRMIFRAQEQVLEEKAQLISATLLTLEDFSPARTAQAVNSLEDLRTTRTVVTDAEGIAIYDSLSAGNAEGKYLLFPEIVSALEGNDVFYGCHDGDAIESRIGIPLMRDGTILGSIYLMQYDLSTGALISALQTNILRISFALEAGIILCALVFSSAFSRRLRRILVSIRGMRDGDYSRKVTLRGHDELSHLGNEFNRLADRLAESEQRRRQFVSDASHELKTPLASIKLLSDSILQNEMDLQTQREFIGDIGREADRLGRLSQKLLMLTRLDSAATEDREILDPCPTISKVVRMLRPLAFLRGIGIQTRLSEGCRIMTVEDDLYQVVFNLVENAIKYNRENGRVEVALTAGSEDVELTVADTGAGIPTEAMEHIFERFYRVDKARSRAAGGAGLGLSIVHDMVVRNYGTIDVAVREGGGSVFTVRFPIFEREDAQ